MRRVFPVLCLLAVLLVSNVSNAQDPLGSVYQRIRFASSPNPVGSGGRAIGWGTAFMAIADDATAANWNPAGLIQLVRPETSIAMSYHSRMEDIDYNNAGSDSQSRSMATANLNYLSVVYPFHFLERNMVASLNYQRMFEYDLDLEYGSEYSEDNYLFDREFKFQQSGSLSTITPSFAVQITPAWSMGLSINFWGLDPSSNGWEQQLEDTGDRNRISSILRRL